MCPNIAFNMEENESSQIDMNVEKKEIVNSTYHFIQFFHICQTNWLYSMADYCFLIKPLITTIIEYGTRYKTSAYMNIPYMTYITR